MNSSCFSLTIPNDFPNELKYKGQPIDPMCFEGNEKKISLNQCGIHFQQSLKMSGQNDNLIKKGYYGYDYQQTDNGNMQAYSYYKVVGQYQHSFVIYRISSGGGSGVFTSINLVKRVNDTLLNDSFMEGDRCNNGIDEPQLANNILAFSVNITPFDYLEIAKLNPHHLKAYDDLASCAACCLGVAHFQADLNNLKKVQFTSIDLGENIEEATSNTQGNYQQCFNKLIVNYMRQKKHTMDLKELRSFVNNFNNECIK